MTTRESRQLGALTISRRTGFIEYEKLRLSPGMAENHLLASVQDAHRLSSYSGWIRYSFQRGDWSVLAAFHSGGLKNVALTCRPVSEGSAWSVEREKQRKLEHDRYLRTWLGWSTKLGRRRFEWGRVESERDPMTGEASITVSYED